MQLVLLSLMLVLLAPLASAQEAAGAWDGKTVADTARSLERALDTLLADPGLTSQQATAMQQRDFDAAVSSAREMKVFVAELVKRLDGGYDRDDSYPFWQRVSLRSDDISAYAGHTWLPAETRAKADRTRKLLERMAGYYAGI
jgi:hypothetical protein